MMAMMLPKLEHTAVNINNSHGFSLHRSVLFKFKIYSKFKIIYTKQKLTLTLDFDTFPEGSSFPQVTLNSIRVE